METNVQNINLTDCVIESNFGPGIYKHGEGLLNLTRCWFENNNRTDTALPGGEAGYASAEKYNFAYVQDVNGDTNIIGCHFEQGAEGQGDLYFYAPRNVKISDCVTSTDNYFAYFEDLNSGAAGSPSIGQNIDNITFLSTGVNYRYNGPKFGTIKFLARAALQSNVTGDGTSYTVIFGTEDFDSGSNYNNTTGIFTAPVKGEYRFSGSVYYSEILAAHYSHNLSIVAGGLTFIHNNTSPASAFPFVASCFPFSVLVDLDAGDTVYIKLLVIGSTKVIDIGTSSYFCGEYVSGK